MYNNLQVALDGDANNDNKLQIAKKERTNDVGSTHSKFSQERQEVILLIHEQDDRKRTLEILNSNSML